MVIRDCANISRPEVKWIGRDETVLHLTQLNNKNVAFYKKCLFGALSLCVGDYILVSNADSADPDTVAGCDIAKIQHLYELREMSLKDPYRAIVQWYSRPEGLPHKIFDDDNICIDFNCEVIQDHRQYDPDISLETIYRKCSVIIGSASDSAATLLQHIDLNRVSCAMFVCRYKFLKVKHTYKLIPLQCIEEMDMNEAARQDRRPRRKSVQQATDVATENDPIDVSGSLRNTKPKTPVSQRKRRVSVVVPTSVEFVDINEMHTNKVSPIKIIGGRSVVKLSSCAKAKMLPTSPLVEKNSLELTPTARAVAARRNLNLSMDTDADTTTDSNCPNYSIVKPSPDTANTTNALTIRLRTTERRRSTRLASLEDDPLQINENVDKLIRDYQRTTHGIVNSSTPNEHDIYSTPSKKSRQSTSEMTPNRRKSILKSTASKLEGTPKRNVQLSSIVEKRIFKNDEVISTPKRGRPKLVRNEDDEDDATYEPIMQTPKKTPTKGRRTTKSTTNTPTTAVPTSAKKLKQIRSGDITPGIVERQTPSSKSRKSDLQLARESLHVSVVPTSLPCRETEFGNIYTFLEGKIQDQCGGCMYVSGVPGTGKTATVTGVIRTLQREAAAEQLPSFEFIEINGMRLTEPRQAYVQIYKQLTGKTLSWEHAHALLEKRFTTAAPRRVTTVLLVDELDILCNRRQDVVYNLLDWPSKSAARLVVVTIANTMDLPERLLMGKVTSRLGLTRLTFQPYTHKQLQEIVTARLSGSTAFKSDAVQLVARKVAAVSGDARRALDICRRATEIADVAGANAVSKELSVNMLHVQQALSEMIASAKVQAIKNCSKLEQLFLQAIVAEVTRTGVEETLFMGIYTQMESIAAFMGTALPSTGRTLRLCSKLGSERLIICEHSRNDIFQKILLNVSMDDIHYALKVNNNNG